MPRILLTVADNAVSRGTASPASKTPTPDVATPEAFVLDIRSLGRRAGTMTEVHRTVMAPERVGVEMIGIQAGADVDLDLRLEAVTEGVLVTGTVSGETSGQCARCLEPIEDTVTVFLTELFAYPNSATEQTTDAEDVHRIDDDRIDLEQPIIDAVAFELPMSPLCREDCQGLCQTCGVRLAVAEPGHGHDIIDPRWQGLAEKFGTLPDPNQSAPETEDGSGNDSETAQ